MDTLKITSLSGPELEHAFLSAVGVQVFGSPKGPFAAFDVQDNKLLVFGAKHDSVETRSFDDDYSLLPLSWAKRSGATFSVEGDQVVCRIGNAQALGSSYSEAAMRALLIKLELAQDKELSNL